MVTINVEGPAGQGTGSGFVVRKDGYILTNNHVLDAAGANGTITVLFSDGTSVDATVVGHDAAYDLAVIRSSLWVLRWAWTAPSPVALSAH